MITILTGPVGGGKTTFLKAVVGRLTALGRPPDGYLSERAGDGRPAPGYDLLDLRTGRRIPFLRIAGAADGLRTGAFDVLPGGLAAAADIIGRSDPSRLLIIDELGRLELGGRGVWPAAAPVFADARRSCLVVVRDTLMEDFQKRWPARIAVAVVPLPPSRDPEILIRALPAGNRL